MTYKSIEEVRAALYPRMRRLLDLDPGELVAVDTALLVRNHSSRAGRIFPSQIQGAGGGAWAVRDGVSRLTVATASLSGSRRTGRCHHRAPTPDGSRHAASR